MKYDWPLNDSHFTWLDRAKLAAFFLNPKNRWTQGVKVKEYEKAWKEFTGAEYVVMTSSGSTANTLIAQYTKDRLGKEGKNVIVFPAVTWVTSVSPWIREGFEPHFIDVSLDNYAMDYDKLEEYLKHNHKKVSTVFLTSLLGFTPNIIEFLTLCDKYNVYLKLDNCEDAFGYTPNGIHTCSAVTSSMSTYFGHQLCSNEGGMIFCEDEEEYCYYLMARNHGMTRALGEYKEKLNECSEEDYINPDVDRRFDFHLLGNNFRSTDINAFMGLLDFERRHYYASKRSLLFNTFKNNLTSSTWKLPKGDFRPFAIPIVSRAENEKVIEEAKKICDEEKIERRPIISGNLLRQTCFFLYGNPEDYPNADFLHRNGFYIGLYPNLDSKKVINFAKRISKL